MQDRLESANEFIDAFLRALPVKADTSAGLSFVQQLRLRSGEMQPEAS
jgi:hypothetical protein